MFGNTRNDVMTQRITLHIGPISFALQIQREHEHLYREAQKLVNATYKQYSDTYPNRSVEELWVLTALRIALNYRQLIENADIDPVLVHLQELKEKIATELNPSE